MAETTKGGKRPNKFACATPYKCCNGTPCGDKIGGVARYHNDEATCRRCVTHYLESQGYEKIGSRDFLSPDDGPILTIPKRALRVKPGKTGYLAKPLKVRPSAPAPRLPS